MTGDFLALCQQNGLLTDPQFSSLGPISNPSFDKISEESWGLAEKVTESVIESIQPTSVSEKRRHDVIEYVQNLVIKYVDCEVLSFGSVPLKTYLPDGDIDLTAIGMPHSEDSLASKVRHVLEMEEKNNDAEFELKDVQYINAEVKLVKCIVQNIVVDISFNQTGGLSTLCFLEHVDRLIGKDHLFKRSVILIKAWCYYESRILGAHHGLISTFGLETMVLYIFHLFHSSLNGPLAILYKFLEYYSNFDWDTFAVSLYGPVHLSSLPDLMVDVSENNEGDTLFTRESLKNYVEQFSDNPRASDNPTRFFPKKHLNIVDPLKDNNNLGRSVGKGNFFRIRSAFGYGAKKLGRLLLSPAECIEDEVNAYFVNTLERHGNGERPDVTKVAYKSKVKSEPCEGLCESLNSLRVSSPPTSSNATSPKFSPFPHMMINPQNRHQKAKTESSSCSSSNTSMLADLCGDFELHNSNLSRVRYTQECMMANLYPVYPRSPVYQYHNSNNTWEWRGRYPHMGSNRVARQFSPFTSGGYGREDLPKPRGTGTYFPNTNYNAYKDQNSPGRRKNYYNYFARTRDSNTSERSLCQESNNEEKGSDNTSLQLQPPAVAGNGQESATKESNAAADNSNGGEAEVKLGTVPVEGGASHSPERGRRSFDSVSPKRPFLDRSRRSFDSANSNAQAASVAALQRSASNNERSAMAQIYRLKDEGDFPPLNA